MNNSKDNMSPAQHRYLQGNLGEHKQTDKTVPNLYMNIKVIKSTQTERILEMKDLGIQTKLQKQALLTQHKRWKIDSKALKIQYRK